MKSGFVALVGRSNVGKSTLLNTLVGTKIAATSFRPQMTRNIIHGVMTTPEGQAIFVDTPGVFRDHHNALSGKLEKKIHEAVEEIDVLVYVVDPSREIGPEERATYSMVRRVEKPKILVINKSDLTSRDRAYQADYERLGKEFDAVCLLSALRGSHVQPLKAAVMSLLPEGELLYPEEQMTNINKEFWVAEIIREKTFSVLEKEVPYSLTVEVDAIEEKPDVTVITARVITMADRYKKMIIGEGGHKIKEIGTMARRELEQAINKKVFLQLEVEVDSHWIERV